MIKTCSGAVHKGVWQQKRLLRPDQLEARPQASSARPDLPHFYAGCGVDLIKTIHFAASHVRHSKTGQCSALSLSEKLSSLSDYAVAETGSSPVRTACDGSDKFSIPRK
jgi:hypothetical protein